MSVLLIPTDFTPASEAAIDYGLQLAGRLGVTVLLTHIYEMPVSMNDVPILLTSVQDLKEASDKNLERTRTTYLERFSSVEIQTVSRMGDTVEELHILTQEYPVLAIVVANPQHKGLDRMLLGSPVSALIRNAAVPVLLISGKPGLLRLEKVAVALHEVPAATELSLLKEFLGRLPTTIELVHVKQKEADHVTLDGVLPELQPCFQLIEDEDLRHGLQSYIQAEQIDLLCILTHRHGWLERLFSKTHETELVDSITIPLVCFPETGRS